MIMILGRLAGHILRRGSNDNRHLLPPRFEGAASGFTPARDRCELEDVHRVRWCFASFSTTWCDCRVVYAADEALARLDPKAMRCRKAEDRDGAAAGSPSGARQMLLAQRRSEPRAMHRAAQGANANASVLHRGSRHFWRVGTVLFRACAGTWAGGGGLIAPGKRVISRQSRSA